MYKSLYSDDFYPLIHSRIKWMSYDEKVVYRIKHNIPSTVDEWIAAARTHTRAPVINPHKRGTSRKLSLSEDNVECILNIVECKVRVYKDICSCKPLTSFKTAI